MARREIIIPAFVGKDAVESVDPFLKHLVGQFTDSLSEADKLLLEYTNHAAMGDLWVGYWDEETGTLSSLTEPGSPEVSVSIGKSAIKDPKPLMPYLCDLCELVS